MIHRLNAFFLSPESDLHHLGVQLVLVGVRVQLGFRRKAVVAAKSPTILVGRPTRWSLLFIFGFLFWSSSWCLRPHIGVSFSVWPLPRAGMVVLDQFFSKMYFLYIWRSPPKNLTEFWGVLAPQNKVYFRALSVSQKMWMSRPHVGKYRWILYDISYGLIINCNESTMIILSDLMKGTCFQTNACK